MAKGLKIVAMISRGNLVRGGCAEGEITSAGGLQPRHKNRRLKHITSAQPVQLTSQN